MAAAGFKKKSTLQAPAMTKKVLRWAIHSRSRNLYLVFLSWPFIAIFLAAVATELFLPSWMFWSIALLSLTKAINRMLVADAAWKRRGRLENQSTP